MALWEFARLPHGFTELWCQELSSLDQLARLRSRLRASLTGSATVNVPAGSSSQVTVVMTGPEFGTVWYYTVHCPAA